MPPKTDSRTRTNGKHDTTAAPTQNARLDAIARAIEAACAELRAIPGVGPLRPADEPMSREDVVMLDHVAAAIDDLLVCAANLTQRALTPEQEKPFREHVREVYLRRFGLDPKSERHARAALVGLIDAAARDVQRGANRVPLEGNGASIATGNVDAATREAIASVFGGAAAWVLSTYAADFPEYAAKLSNAEKYAQLGRVLYWWWLNVERCGVSEKQQWDALEELGTDVFKKSERDDWRVNVWWALKDLVAGSDVSAE